MTRSQSGRLVSPAPDSLVHNGRFQLGTYNTPFQQVNPLDATRPLGVPAPRWLRSFRLKEWQAFQLLNETHFVLGAIYNAKAMALVQLVVVEKQTGHKQLYEKRVPPWSLQVANGLYASQSEYKTTGFALGLQNDLGREQIRLTVDIQAKDGLPAIRGTVVAHHTTEPIVICQPFGENRALYSHKALMPAEGQLVVGGDTLSFETDRACMIVDDHKGYYPFPMKYDWVTAAGFTSDGTLAGFNLTDNQVLDHDRFNENCLWYAGGMQPLAPVRVERPDGVYAPWHITDTEGRVELTFVPKVKSEVMVNIAGVLGSDYYGPYGEFDGRIQRADGAWIDLSGFYGMGEQKTIRL